MARERLVNVDFKKKEIKRDNKGTISPETQPYLCIG